MKIASLFAALPVFSISLISCVDSSSGVDDELAGETAQDDAVDGKADSAVDGASTYFEISSDLRRCVSPLCGGFFLDRLNRATTVCHDGKAAAACYTPELDMSESGLSDAARDKLVEAANLSTRPGVRAIVRGRFGKTNSTTIPSLGRFVVTEVWVSQSDTVSSGVFVRAKDNGVRCIAAPCPTTTEKALNTSRQANIAEIDFADANLSDSVLEQVGNDLFTPSGAIFAGDRFKFTFSGRKGIGRTATAVYRRLLETNNTPSTPATE